MAGFHGFPPAAMAFATSASTCSRLSADRLVTTSVVVAVADLTDDEIPEAVLLDEHDERVVGNDHARGLVI
jgi:hypothetical protein